MPRRPRRSRLLRRLLSLFFLSVVQLRRETHSFVFFLSKNSGRCIPPHQSRRRRGEGCKSVLKKSAPAEMRETKHAKACSHRHMHGSAVICNPSALGLSPKKPSAFPGGRHSFPRSARAPRILTPATPSPQRSSSLLLLAMLYSLPALLLAFASQPEPCPEPIVCPTCPVLPEEATCARLAPHSRQSTSPSPLS